MTTYSVTSGVLSSGITVHSGDLLFVESGGTAVYTTVSALGSAVVSSGGAVSFTTVSGGDQYVYAGGRADSTTVTREGAEVVSSGGTTTGALSTDLGDKIVLAGGTASFTTLSGGFDGVRSGGTTISTIVDNDGYENVFSGGVTSATTVNFASQEWVYSGGTTVDTFVNSAGYEPVSAGGEAISTTVNDSGTELLTPRFFGSFIPPGNATDTVLNDGGMIDVEYLQYASGGSAGVNSSDLLTVSVGGQSYTQQLSGNYAGVHFQIARDETLLSGSLITAEAPCYRCGTLILTDRGEVAVEALRIGDLVETMLGETTAPIVWVGQRQVDCAHHPKPRQVWPVRVAAGALGLGQPHSELFLSPDHADYVCDVLIPIRLLINGTTIVQVPVHSVTYHHFELPRHNVVLAQGLPAESFLDLKDGSNYANRPGPIRLYPDFTARMWEAFGCARLIVTGTELMAAWALVDRFAKAPEAA